MNSYVPKFVPKDVPLYERYGLMTWYDEIKCEDFLRDTDKHFQQAKIINFDITHRQCCGEVSKNLLKQHQKFNDKSDSDYPALKQDRILSSAFQTDRKKILFEKKSCIKTFQQKNKIKTLLFCKNYF